MKYVQCAGRSGILVLIAGIVVSCATMQSVPKGQNSLSSRSVRAEKSTDPSGSTSPPSASSPAPPPAPGSPSPSTSTSEPKTTSADGAVSGPPPAPALTGKTANPPEAAKSEVTEVASAGSGQAGAGNSGSTPSTGPTAPVPQTAQSIPPLSAAQVNAGILAQGVAGAWPLVRQGHVLEVSRRVSAAENPEVFAVFVDVATAADAEAASLSDFSRLFKQELNPVEFSLVQFSQENGRLRRGRSFPLGKYMVFESLRIVPIRKGFDMPFAASVTFQTQEGSDDIWVTFSHHGTSQITLQQTLSRSPIVEDIDGDGYLDIVNKERGIEEGTGYETFLTWYKWDGGAYKEYKTTNIVRNLRDFLSSAEELLSNDTVAEFFRTSIPAEELARLKSKGQSSEEIFKMIFHLIPSSPDNPNPPLTGLRSIRRVIFPNIFENPFTEQDERGYSFPMTVRIVSNDGTSHFYGAKVYMHKNPFVAPQFSFSVEPN